MNTKRQFIFKGPSRYPLRSLLFVLLDHSVHVSAILFTLHVNDFYFHILHNNKKGIMKSTHKKIFPAAYVQILYQFIIRKKDYRPQKKCVTGIYFSTLCLFIGNLENHYTKSRPQVYNSFLKKFKKS